MAIFAFFAILLLYFNFKKANDCSEVFTGLDLILKFFIFQKTNLRSL